MIKIIHLTDMHVLGPKNAKFLGVDSKATLKTVVEKVKTIRQPHLIVLGGDITNDSAISSYNKVAGELNQLQALCVWTMGNHDDQTKIDKTLVKASNFSPAKVIQFKSWQIILLDSSYKNHLSGRLHKEDLALLQTTLGSNPNKHTIIFLHHQVLPVGSKWLDQMRLENYSEFLKIVRKHSNIKVIVSGHTHQASATRRYGMDFLTTPSASVQFAPQSNKMTLDTTMPGFRTINLYSTGRYTTKIQRIKKNKDFIPDLKCRGY